MGPVYPNQGMGILEKLILQHLPSEAAILDLCCGPGHLSHELATRGYKVTGLDGSEEMICFARKKAPDSNFILADARIFELPNCFDGVVCTFDSINNMLSLDDVHAVFASVLKSLHPGGLFMFDLNMEEGYQAHWQKTISVVEEDHVYIARLSYHPDERVGRDDMTIFSQCEQGWQRTDLVFIQRAYTETEVTAALEQIGFTEVHVYDPQRDLNLGGQGRLFFVCRKPPLKED